MFFSFPMGDASGSAPLRTYKIRMSCDLIRLVRGSKIKLLSKMDNDLDNGEGISGKLSGSLTMDMKYDEYKAEISVACVRITRMIDLSVEKNYSRTNADNFKNVSSSPGKDYVVGAHL